MLSQTLLLISWSGALAFYCYWTGRRHGENCRAVLLDEIDHQQRLIDDLTDVVLGGKPAHPAIRRAV
jgi:hypothetical protein